jgi:hypothetical protein
MGFELLIEKLKSYYHCPRNRLLECQKFRSRDQKVHENVSDYALELKRLSRTCEFGDSLEENLLEKFVTGLTNGKIKQKLMSIKNLTWTQAQEEAISNKTTENSTLTDSVHRVQATRGNHGNHFNNRGNFRNNTRNVLVIKCTRCSGAHSSNQCRHKDSQCHNCGRYGHIKIACKSSANFSRGGGRRGQGATVNSRQQSQRYQNSRGSVSSRYANRSAVHQLDIDIENNGENTIVSNEKDVNAYSICSIGGSNKEFSVTVQVEGQEILMSVDTQASVSVIPDSLYSKYFKHCVLQPSSAKLKSYSGHVIPVRGKICVNVCYNNCVYNNLSLIVVHGENDSLLGRDWLKIIRLNWNNLVQEFHKCVNQVKCKTIDDVLNDYECVFKRTQYN